MPIYQLDDAFWFPPISLAEPDGLLAIGGDLLPERLLLAYKSGIFPWFGNEDPILWWSPDPRMVLYPDRLKISSTMRQVLKKNEFKITYNTNFRSVITQCSKIKRKGQEDTWIINEMIEAYCKLHTMGFAHSVESWKDGQLVGGLYGVGIGDCFFGESMFSNVSNASKAAFITFVENKKSAGLRLIDCQVHTPHLESLGAEMISRDVFLGQITIGCQSESIFAES